MVRINPKALGKEMIIRDSGDSNTVPLKWQVNVLLMSRAQRQDEVWYLKIGLGEEGEKPSLGRTNIR
jgi:hypothetical protein